MNIEKLLLKVLNDEASSKEYAALESWKKESEENLKLLQELQTKHTDIQDGYKDYDKNAAWHKVESRIFQSEQAPQQKPAYLRWIMLAAILLVGLFGLWHLSNQEPAQPKDYKSAEQTMQFALEDKTDIWLRDGGSELKVISNFEEERRVALTGEAFFDVAHDIDRPFIIQLDNQDYVRVVGTSFNLLNEGGEFDLTLYSGVVELKMNNRTITLQKGDRAKKVNGAIVKYRNNDDNIISWKSNDLVFDNVTIVEAFSVIENHFKTTIDYSSSTNNPAGCAIKSKFTNENLDGVLSELSDILGFNYKTLNGKVLIKDLACN
jgi:ferric-dicitrate binding protein FerR (iron transport regulator)